MSEQNVRMQQFGKNLRQKARELGLTDAEVARRVGISERRYGFYVTGDREPDLATLLKIADVLMTSADQLLRLSNKPKPSVRDRLQAQIQASAETLPTEHLQLLADTAMAFSRHSTKGGVGSGFAIKNKINKNN